MFLSADEARRRIRSALRQVSPALALDSGAVRWLGGPYPGFEYGLRLGEANALLFLPARDVLEEDWEERLAARLREAAGYMERFPLAKVRR